MMILFIIVTGVVVGMLPGLIKLDRMFSFPNIVLALVGAFIGAFLGFGDAPILLKYSFLNEKTLAVAVSFLFILAKVFATRNRQAP
jgi:uncharacterized membrane protein YeaQ/YmgE (transglycosylase-associated protein family)